METDRRTWGQTDGHGDRHMDMGTDRHGDRQTDIGTDRQLGTNKWTWITYGTCTVRTEIDTWTNKHRNRHMNMGTDI